ncbi:hypothetical protein [Nitrospirillum iridis]|uniref:Uncharacterized protein n=1 Tax=Nitrospirillum iridis TaxID=765888 RepID=A0A7X0B1B0_9PROT|nr:hypothetical protein [Nitrospirillum iridis]MBB6252354.1 hypothetical protein [Nitrospirillum iridis]
MVVVDPSGAETVTVLVTVLVEELPLALLVEPLLSEEDVEEEDASLDVLPPDCSKELSETVMLVPVVDEMLVMDDIPQM